MRVAVLGGGIAGVLVARTLAARGYELDVFEAAPRIGGLCGSEVVDGFVFDVAGGHVLHSRDREALDAMLEVLDDPVENERNTKIYYRGDYVKYPFENGLADLPVDDRLECVMGYLEAYVAREKGAPEPTNFHDWISWRFGSGMARQFMLPYNRKIWCVDLHEVSTAWVRDRVPEAPLEDVVKAGMGIESDGYKHQMTFHYPRRGGFESLVTGFAKGIEDSIRTSTPVTSVVRDGDGFSVNGERFDRIVNTLPLKCLFPLLDPAPPEPVAAALGALRHLSLSTVLVALDVPDPSPYSWVYLPHAEDGPMNRITYLHNYSPENAPEGQSSILAEVTSVGGEGPPDLDALEATVVDALAGAGMLDRDSVRFTHSAFSEYAYAVHDHDFDSNRAVVLDWLDAAGIPSLGRFARYAYVNSDQVFTMVRDALADDFAPLD